GGRGPPDLALLALPHDRDRRLHRDPEQPPRGTTPLHRRRVAPGIVVEAPVRRRRDALGHVLLGLRRGYRLRRSGRWFRLSRDGLRRGLDDGSLLRPIAPQRLFLWPVARGLLLRPPTSDLRLFRSGLEPPSVPR